MKKITLLVLVASQLNLGCVIHRPKMEETTTRTEGSGTNTVTTVQDRKLKLTSIALWPGKQSAEGAKMSLGKTMSVGVTGLEQESSGGTNSIRQLEAATSLLRAATGH